MLIYKLWARVEVYDTDTDEHYDVDPEIAESKSESSANLKMSPASSLRAGILTATMKL